MTCEHCGGTNMHTHGCMRCGAPVCCDDCCKEATRAAYTAPDSSEGASGIGAGSPEPSSARTTADSPTAIPIAGTPKEPGEQQGRPDLPSGGPVAWMTEGGRVISESDKVTAMRGTPKWQAKAMRFSIPLYRSAPEVDFRPAVRWFADAMEARLKENDHKRGWEESEWEYLVRCMKDEVMELDELFDHKTGKVLGGSNAIINEACDVANFAMMIADNHGPRIGSDPSRLLSGPSGSGEESKYMELIYAVARKFPGETRHQTALRYIMEAEDRAFGSPAKLLSQTKPNE